MAHPDLMAVNESTVAGLGRLAGFFGFNDVMARLYGTLLMNPEPLSLDDLAEKLDISKGSVSMNMRSLERWGMAQEHWMRGERKKYYTVESDMWKVIRNVLSGREQREVMLALHILTESVEKLRSAESHLSEEEVALAHYYLERIADLQAFFNFAQIALQAVLGSQSGINFESISKIELMKE